MQDPACGVRLKSGNYGSWMNRGSGRVAHREPSVGFFGRRSTQRPPNKHAKELRGARRRGRGGRSYRDVAARMVRSVRPERNTRGMKNV